MSHSYPERAVAGIEVPVVDLAGLGDTGTRDESDPTAMALCRALSDFGFVRLAGHDVDPSELQRVDALFAEFFAWSEERKSKVSGVAGGQRGYTAFGREHARDRDRPDLKAFYHVGQPAPRGGSAGDFPANVFPDDLPELRDVSLSLFAALERTASRVLRTIEIGWSLDPGTLADMIDGGNSILRALHYPALEEEAFEAERRAGEDCVDASGRPAVLRAAPHEDINLVTLLPASGEPGLEILAHDATTGADRWVAIATQPGEIVADVGDMLARLSGGHLPATTHRVVATADVAGRDRRAHPFFAHPRPECDLSVHPAFMREGEAPLWPPITAGAFLAERLREIGLAD